MNDRSDRQSEGSDLVALNDLPEDIRRELVSIAIKRYENSRAPSRGGIAIPLPSASVEAFRARMNSKIQPSDDAQVAQGIEGRDIKEAAKFALEVFKRSQSELAKGLVPIMIDEIIPADELPANNLKRMWYLRHIFTREYWHGPDNRLRDSAIATLRDSDPPGHIRHELFKRGSPYQDATEAQREEIIETARRWARIKPYIASDRGAVARIVHEWAQLPSADIGKSQENLKLPAHLLDNEDLQEIVRTYDRGYKAFEEIEQAERGKIEQGLKEWAKPTKWAPHVYPAFAHFLRVEGTEDEKVLKQLLGIEASKSIDDTILNHRWESKKKKGFIKKRIERAQQQRKDSREKKGLARLGGEDSVVVSALKKGFPDANPPIPALTDEEFAWYLKHKANPVLYPKKGFKDPRLEKTMAIYRELHRRRISGAVLSEVETQKEEGFNLSDDVAVLEREYAEMQRDLSAATTRFEADPTLVDVKHSIEDALPLMEAYERKIAQLKSAHMEA